MSAEALAPKAEKDIVINPFDYKASLGIALNWYNIEGDEAKLRKHAQAYFKEQGRQDIIAAIAKATFHQCRTVLILSRLKQREQHLEPKEEQTFLDRINELLNPKEKFVSSLNVVPTTAPKPTQRTLTPAEKHKKLTSTIIAELEYAIDTFIEQKKPGFKISSYLLSAGATPAAAKEAAEWFSGRIVQELKELLGTKPDPQLVEGYSYMTKPEQKALLKFIEEEIVGQCKTLGAQTAQVAAAKSAAVTKPTVAKPKKPPSVADFKYQVEEKPLKLKSVSPTKIHLSKEVWVYRTKDRTLTVIKGKELSLSGTSITGGEDIKVKTIRKPEEFFHELSPTKITLNKRFNDLTTKAADGSGRCNDTCIILGVF